MPWLKFIAFFCGGVLLLSFIVRFLISLNRYLPQLQSMASEALGEPVTIAESTFARLPVPSITFTRITMGKTRVNKIDVITIRSDLWSLLSEVKVLRAVEIRGVTANRHWIDSVAAFARQAPADAQAFQINAFWKALSA